MIDSDIPIINSKILREKIQENSIRIVDVRRDQEYQQGHITNAVNLPLAKLLNDDSPESKQKIAQLEKINEKNLSNRDKKIRRELINREKEILKGVKPRTLASIASKVGLKSSAFIEATPLSLFVVIPAGYSFIPIIFHFNLLMFISYN